MPFLLASLTGPLVNFATNLIDSIGLAGVALLTLSSGVIGVPGTEPTMLFAGFDVFQGDLTLPGIIVAGVVGDVAGASIAYSIGYFGSRELLESHGSKLHVSGAGIERAHRWFDRYGSPVIFVSRFLPLIRAAFPYAAGVARMPFGRFIAFATAGSIFWIGGLAVLGREVGSQWEAWRKHLEYVDYAAVVLLVVLVVVFVIRWRQGRGDGDRRQAEPATDVVAD